MNSIKNSDNFLKTKKFYRRNDITPLLRIWIALNVIFNNKWGAVTRLASDFIVSRTFVYMLLKEVSNCTISDIKRGQMFEGPEIAALSTTSEILMLRLIGKCSIPAIHEILTHFNPSGKGYSVGNISKTLNEIGSTLDNTVHVTGDSLQPVFASDELFAYGRPILVTVDPQSTAILRMELADQRTAELWQEHWEGIEMNGCECQLLVNDEGTAMKKAYESMLKDKSQRQADTFHAASHRLGKWVEILLTKAESAIEHEYKREKVFLNAVSKENQAKQLEKYQQARQDSEQQVEIYELFHFFYLCIIESLEIFDKRGCPKDLNGCLQDIETALELIEQLGIAKINGQVRTIRKLVPDLLNYKNIAAQIYAQLLQQGIDKEILSLFCLAWQNHKKTVKAKKQNRKAYFKQKEAVILDVLRYVLSSNDEFEQNKEKIYAGLNKIVQSSAIVECINSIIRPYLDTMRNQVNQNMLNLIMFYHNHRRYSSGERKGKSPIEILTGAEQKEPWYKKLESLYSSAA